MVVWRGEIPVPARGSSTGELRVMASPPVTPFADRVIAAVATAKTPYAVPARARRCSRSGDVLRPPHGDRGPDGAERGPEGMGAAVAVAEIADGETDRRSLITEYLPGCVRALRSECDRRVTLCECRLRDSGIRGHRIVVLGG